MTDLARNGNDRNMDIATFLLARIAEDERWATDASRRDEWLIDGGAHWQWVAGEDWATVQPDPAVDEYVGDGSGALVSVEEAVSNVPNMPIPQVALQQVEVRAVVAGHIVRWDPARILADCASKRRLVELHGGEHDVCLNLDGVNKIGVNGDCAVMLLLAAPYSEVDGFDPAWGTT